MKTTKTTK